MQGLVLSFTQTLTSDTATLKPLWCEEPILDSKQMHPHTFALVGILFHTMFD